MQPKYSSAAQTRYGGSIMRRIIFILLMSLVAARLLAGEKPVAEDELTTFEREYADVLALQGTPKDEILAIARILRAKPGSAIGRPAASGDYRLNRSRATP